MAIRPGIPLGQDDQGAAPVSRRWKPSGMDRVVLRIGGERWGGKRKAALAQLVIADRMIGEEAVGVLESLIGKTRKALRRRAIGLRGANREIEAPQPVRSPLEGPDDPVGIAGGQFPLPPVDPPSVESCHVLEKLTVYQRKNPTLADGTGVGMRISPWEATHQSVKPLQTLQPI